MPAPLRIATRRSPLALGQASSVAARLDVETELVLVDTLGDQRPEAELHAMGGVGVFMKEVQQAVLDGRADLAVHSAKDLPAGATPGLVLGAFPERADPRDALVGSRLDDLPTGAVVGTGSVRRRAQLAAHRPDLGFGNLRGNIATRLARLDTYAAVVVAHAALERLGLAERASETLEASVLLPQVGQGALAVECRDDDLATHARLGRVDDPVVRAAVVAERAYLAALGGGCDLPVGALARVRASGTIDLDAMLATFDGRVVLRVRHSGTDPEALGAATAAALLDGAGGRDLLDPVGVER